jgi:hypothetical protein
LIHFCIIAIDRSGRSIVRMILRYETGRRVEAVLLAANSRRMRVAIDSAGDTTTLVRADDCWRGEDGEIVEIEALIALSGTEVAPLSDGARPKMAAAGRGFGSF